MRDEHGGRIRDLGGWGGAPVSLRIGVVGAGQMGRYHIGRLAGSVPDAEVVAISDVYLEGAEQVAGQVGARAYADGHELVADDRVEAVLRSLKSLRVTHLRTAVSWADWCSPEGERWIEWLVPRLSEEVSLLPCFHYTPPSRAVEPRTAAPPKVPGEFGDFVAAAGAVIIVSYDKKNAPSGKLPGRLKVLILPAEVRESLVGLRHLVNVVTLADCAALTLIGFHDLRSERVAHRRAFAAIGEFHDPTQRERGLTIGRNFERHLIGRPTNAAGFGFNTRLGIVHRALEDFHRIACGILLGKLIERTINDALRGALLARKHDGIDEARNERALVFPILSQGTFGCLTAT